MNELSERHEQWIAAVSSRDIESYAELVAEDVVWIPPAGHAIVGRRAFREWLEPFFEAYESEFSTADHRYRAAGDWVAESGAFESRMTPATGGSAMSHVGSYLALWKCDVDGIWRIDRYVDQASREAIAEEPLEALPRLGDVLKDSMRDGALGTFKTRGARPGSVWS